MSADYYSKPSCDWDRSIVGSVITDADTVSYIFGCENTYAPLISPSHSLQCRGRYLQIPCSPGETYIYIYRVATVLSEPRQRVERRELARLAIDSSESERVPA
jgi:hypothetical protein